MPPQHDQNLANQSGANFRTDLNNALAALFGNSSGATEPTTTIAYQLWADTTTGLLKIRNAANSGWVTIGTLASYGLGLNGIYSSASDPSASAYAYFLWVDTSGSPKTLKIRNAANSAWITIGTVESANFGLLPLSGGTMTAAISYSNTDYTMVPVGTTGQRPGSPATGMIRFNTTLSQFEVYNGSAWTAAGAGGGVQVKWFDGELAPNFTLYNDNIPCWEFAATQGQKLYAVVKVPAGYTAGQQLNLKASFFSNDTSGNVYFKTKTTLIRQATDQITDTTNQRTSSQGAVTVSGGTQLEPQVITCDLTDTSGQINGVAVAANDVLHIEFFRDSTDTATGSAYLLPEQSEVK